MAIPLDYEIDTPDGGTVSYGIAQVNEGSSTPLTVRASWDQSASASVTYWCEWNDINQFMLAMVGDNTVVEVGTTKQFSRFLPHKLPDTSFYNLWCTGVEISGLPGSDATDPTIKLPTYSDLEKLKYRYAKVVASYEPSIWPMLSDNDTPYNKEWMRFTSITKTPRLEFLTIAAGSLYWVDSPEKAKQSALPHNIPLREQSVDWVVTFHRCPEAFFVPSDYIGYTNSNDLFLDGHPQVRANGFSPDTMLLLGINEIIKPTCFREEPYYDYQYLFQERPNTHNKARRYVNKTPAGVDVVPPTFEYTKFSLDGLTPSTNATRVFKQINMGDLFLPNV